MEFRERYRADPGAFSPDATSWIPNATSYSSDDYSLSGNMDIFVERVFLSLCVCVFIIFYYCYLCLWFFLSSYGSFLAWCPAWTHPLTVVVAGI